MTIGNIFYYVPDLGYTLADPVTQPTLTPIAYDNPNNRHAVGDLLTAGDYDVSYALKGLTKNGQQVITNFSPAQTVTVASGEAIQVAVPQAELQNKPVSVMFALGLAGGTQKIVAEVPIPMKFARNNLVANEDFIVQLNTKAQNCAKPTENIIKLKADVNVPIHGTKASLEDYNFSPDGHGLLINPRTMEIERAFRTDTYITGKSVEFKLNIITDKYRDFCHAMGFAGADFVNDDVINLGSEQCGCKPPAIIEFDYLGSCEGNGKAIRVMLPAIAPISPESIELTSKSNAKDAIPINLKSVSSAFAINEAIMTQEQLD